MSLYWEEPSISSQVNITGNPYTCHIGLGCRGRAGRACGAMCVITGAYGVLETVYQTQWFEAGLRGACSRTSNMKFLNFDAHGWSIIRIV
jgi:hypothetical protein